jgi:signal transduction histidine kinase
MALRFTAPDGAAQVELRPEVRRAVYLVLKEAIHNAARHSGAAAVEVSIALRDGAVEGEVRDDGGGIETARAVEAERDGHRGLPGMRRRAEAVGGVLTLDAPPGAGTRVRLRVPLRGGRLSHGDARRRSATGDTTSSA